MAKLLRFLTLAFLGMVLPSLLLADDTTPQLFVAKIKNKVSIVRGGKKYKAVVPATLEETDRVVTGASSQAYLQFENGSVVEVGPNSDVKVGELDTQGSDFKAKFLLAFGKLKAKVQKLTTSSSSFEIEAGGVVAGVRGTVFGVDYGKAKNVVNAQTFEGSIFTLVGGKEEIVQKGLSLVVGKTGLPVQSPLTQEAISDFKDFNGVSGLLEKKKQEMMNQMKQKAGDQVREKVGHDKEDLIKKVVDPSKLGF